MTASGIFLPFCLPLICWWRLLYFSPSELGQQDWQWKQFNWVHLSLEQGRKPSEEHLPWQDCREETDLPLEVHGDAHLGQKGGWMGQFLPWTGTAFFLHPLPLSMRDFKEHCRQNSKHHHLNLWLHFYSYLDKLGQHLFCACVYIQTHMCTHLDALATKP